MTMFVRPQVYMVAHTQLCWDALSGYLADTDNLAFRADAASVSGPEALCSFAAKLCYNSLSPGHNANVKQVRDIQSNFRGCLAAGHGSVLEHASATFVATGVSRVFEVELVRHRVGTAFSVESGRNQRVAAVDFAWNEDLAPLRELLLEHGQRCEELVKRAEELVGLSADLPQAERKRLTSAVRRLLPEGKTKQLVFTINFRALRHLVELRTSRHAEREIRDVFGQVYRLARARFPLLFSDAQEREAGGLLEVYGMKHQPYSP